MKEKDVIIETQGVCKTYNEGMESEIQVLKDIDLKVGRGEFLAIMGPSGSGKTTLLDVLGCLLRPKSGRVLIEGDDIGRLDDDELAAIRRKKIGFIFQQYNLIPVFTALENVAFAARIAGMNKHVARERAEDVLNAVDLGKRMDHRPSELSGGEQQRVAISRALVNEPEIILGDEPTGNLDTDTGNMILSLLKKLNKENNYTIIVVTHDTRISRFANRTIRLMDGMIVK